MGQDGPYVFWTDATSINLRKPGSSAAIVLGEGAFPVIAGSKQIYAAWEHQGTITVEQVR